MTDEGFEEEPTTSQSFLQGLTDQGTQKLFLVGLAVGLGACAVYFIAQLVIARSQSVGTTSVES
jgi:hypothetical protein